MRDDHFHQYAECDCIAVGHGSTFVHGKRLRKAWPAVWPRVQGTAYAFFAGVFLDYALFDTHHASFEQGKQTAKIGIKNVEIKQRAA